MYKYLFSQMMILLCVIFHLDKGDETALDTTKNIILPHLTKGGSYTVSSQEVSQLVSQSGLSPVLTMYKQYLQSCYKAKVLAPADKYLPTLESPYINLAMIRRGRYNHKQRDEFTRRTLHGGVDQILENKTPINIEDLLTPENVDERFQMRVEGSDWLMHQGRESPIQINAENLSNLEYSDFLQGFPSVSQTPDNEFPVTQRFNPVSNAAERSKRPVRFILVEGPPGIGKSTFAWEVCRRWDEIESLRDYHTVVLLKLREKWVLNATSLSDLLRYPSHPDFSNSIADELVQSQGEKLLFVLDGFDEVSHSFTENSVIKSILCRQLLPECTIILTTRPVAMYTLRSICQPQVDKHVEIIGFTEEERVRYITEVFSKVPELQVNFLKYMFHVPHIKSMMYIPLNCAIIAQVYYESQSSRHLAIPRTRTQLYKALTHSLLVRHLKMKESKCECASMLPDSLGEENMKHFKTLAKFAFDAYHKGSRKVTFFKEDIPEGLVHFGFMNESTEMYAGKGVEQTFSFLHLSLQEYLAALYLADSYSIEFQVAYHRLAFIPPPVCFLFKQKVEEHYKGDNKEEEALILSLRQQRPSLVEPAIFMAGITGWRCQSGDGRNHWEMYLSHDTVGKGNASVLLRSLYEAQNPTLLPPNFTDYDDSQRKFLIGSSKYICFGDHGKDDLHTPYDCYALSYCVANSSYQFRYILSFAFNKENDIALVETFVKGLNDHCLSTIPKIKYLKIEESSPSLVNRGLIWLMRAKFLATVEESILDTSIINNNAAETFLSFLVNLQSLTIHDSLSVWGDYPTPFTSWEWLSSLKSLTKLKVLDISYSKECNPPQTDLLCWLIECRLTAIALDIKFPSNTMYELDSPTYVLVDSVLKSVLRSKHITKLVLPYISQETMASVHNILLHCPGLAILKLKRTVRLGYDGILYICSALRNNTTFRQLVIHEHSQFLLSEELAVLSAETTCTNLLLELCNIVRENTLEVMDIQCESFSTCGYYNRGMIFELKLYNISSDVAYNVLQLLIKIQFLKHVRYCEWIASPESLKHLHKLHICNKSKCDSEVPMLCFEFSKTNITPDICNAVDKAVDLILKFVIQFNTLTKIALTNISRKTVAGVQNMLSHCPNLTSLELKRTRLGCDEVLYIICSALRNSMVLRHLVIHDDLQSMDDPQSQDDAVLSGKTTCTNLLLELSNIVKDNSLKQMSIQSPSSSTSGDGGGISFVFQMYNISSEVAYNVLQRLVRIHSYLDNIILCEWIASPQSLKHLEFLHITNKSYPFFHENTCTMYNIFQDDISEDNFPILDIEFSPIIYNSVVDLVLEFNIVNVTLSNVSRQTMAGVRCILLHCPSLTALKLERTRLGYDGILYICRTLRKNTVLKYLVIGDDILLPRWHYNCNITFSFMEGVALPGKTTCTDFLLELNNILKENTTLKEMKIQSGLFLPLSARGFQYCQWTGLGPLQQFNVGAVGSGISPNLKRSFSSSDLTQSQTTLFWDRQFHYIHSSELEVNFKKLFSKRKEEGKKLFSLPSFTAPDTEILQSFSGLDPRLKECLEISHLHEYVESLKKTCWGMLGELKK